MLLPVSTTANHRPTALLDFNVFLCATLKLLICNLSDQDSSNINNLSSRPWTLIQPRSYINETLMDWFLVTKTSLLAKVTRLETWIHHRSYINGILMHQSLSHVLLQKLSNLQLKLPTLQCWWEITLTIAKPKNVSRNITNINVKIERTTYYTNNLVFGNRWQNKPCIYSLCAKAILYGNRWQKPKHQ